MRSLWEGFSLKILARIGECREMAIGYVNIGCFICKTFVALNWATFHAWFMRKILGGFPVFDRLMISSRATRN